MEHSSRTILARNLRRKQSDAEKKMWSVLRSRQFENNKFRRQEPIGEYIVDFVSYEKKLIIEIDGDQHNQSLEIEKDAIRTKWLEGRGYQVLRFWNNDVLLNIDGVGTSIFEALQTH
jgi:very-short-patch-repair endonuclease